PSDSPSPVAIPGPERLPAMARRPRGPSHRRRHTPSRSRACICSCAWGYSLVTLRKPDWAAIAMPGGRLLRGSSNRLRTRQLVRRTGYGRGEVWRGATDSVIEKVDRVSALPVFDAAILVV